MNEKLCKKLRKAAKMWDGFQGQEWKTLYKRAKKQYRMARLMAKTNQSLERPYSVLGK